MAAIQQPGTYPVDVHFLLQNNKKGRLLLKVRLGSWCEALYLTPQSMLDALSTCFQLIRILHYSHSQIGLSFNFW